MAKGFRDRVAISLGRVGTCDGKNYFRGRLVKVGEVESYKIILGMEGQKVF